MKEIIVPSEKIPVTEECDICVIGGSCTGVFAAIRAARLGAKVTIVEKQNRFGGVATNSLVNMWHSLYDIDFNQQIIAGLTLEAMERLAKRNAIAHFINSKDYGVPFNSEELTIELDEMAFEAGIKIHFHTFFSSAVMEDKKVSAVIIQDKSGRKAIKARIFIDASGDADLCVSAGIDTYIPEHIQPPTTCARFSTWDFCGINPYELIMEHSEKYKIPAGFFWGTFVPPHKDVYMLNGTRVTGKNPSEADALTYCEIEGRRQVRAITDIFRKYLKGRAPQLNALPSYIGIRESRHIHSLHKLKGEDILHGKKFNDAIANGTYPVDIHHQEKAGITFRYLDGRELYKCPGKKNVEGRWRNESSDNPKFYQIPLRSLIPQDSKNIICAGRMLDADKEAFAAARVMVNLNQTGEAAGVAAYLALEANAGITEISSKKVRKRLLDGGSCII